MDDDDEVSVGVVTFLKETEKAILVETADDESTDREGEEKWIPKSQVAAESPVPYEVEEGDSGELIISRWFAKKEDWIDDDDE